MYKYLLILLALINPTLSQGQFIGIRNNSATGYTEYYQTNSPGNTPIASRTVWSFPDSTKDWKIYVSDIYFDSLKTRVNGFPSKLLWLGVDGLLSTSPISTIFDSVSNKYYSKTQSDARYVLAAGVTPFNITDYQKYTDTATFDLTRYKGDSLYQAKGSYLIAETDPIWDIEKNNYYTIDESEGIFLQTEVDPYWHSDSSSYYKKSVVDSKLDLKLNITDTFNHWLPIGYVPTWTSITGKPTFATVSTTGSYNDLTDKPTIPTNNNQLSNGAGYLTVETDPQFDTKFSVKSTTNLTEGANQYFTTTRARSSVSAGTGISYNSSTGVITNSSPDQTVSLTGAGSVAITGTYPSFTITGNPNIDSVKFYNSSGPINRRIKCWTGIISPSTSNGYSIDISSAGFTTILSISIIAQKNSSSPYLVPNVSIKSMTTSAIVVNIAEANGAVVNILGINVLSGGPLVFADITGLSIQVVVYGY